MGEGTGDIEVKKQGKWLKGGGAGGGGGGEKKEGETSRYGVKGRREEGRELGGRRVRVGQGRCYGRRDCVGEKGKEERRRMT